MIQESLYDYVMDRLQALGTEEKARVLMRFFKCGPGGYGQGDRFMGVKVPEIRALVKACPQTPPLEDLHRLLMEPWHEARMAALLLLKQSFCKALRKNPDQAAACVDFYLAHTARINNWDLVDLSCTHILGPWLQDRDRTLLYTLAHSPLLWEQRIAMVTTLHFVRRGDFALALHLALSFLDHPHDLMHKAVGWVLREMGKKDPLVLRQFVDAHWARMPRTTLRYAIEKYPEAERKAVLARR